jgi:hypothetical protein
MLTNVTPAPSQMTRCCPCFNALRTLSVWLLVRVTFVGCAIPSKLSLKKPSSRCHRASTRGPRKPIAIPVGNQHSTSFCKELDAHEYPFTRNVAAQLREHDDRAEFLAGIDLILAGIAASL